MLAERLYTEGVASGEDWNFGPDQLNVKPVAWIADQLCAQWGGLSWQQDGQPETQDTALIDSTKARAVLGWTPRLDLKTTLQWLLDWTRAYQNHANMRYYSEAQIKQFMQLGQPQATSNQISAQQRLRVASVNHGCLLAGY
jgi:CDP-glucose 4,6-dehydratase